MRHTTINLLDEETEDVWQYNHAQNSGMTDVMQRTEQNDTTNNPSGRGNITHTPNTHIQTEGGG